MDDNQSHFITNMASTFACRKLSRITGSILWFKQNGMDSKLLGSLEIHEIEYSEKLCIKIIQKTTPGKITWTEPWIMMEYEGSTA